MDNYINPNLVKRANLPNLIVRQVCCGTYTGQWRGALPRNRLIYIFEPGETPCWIGDQKTTCDLIPGKWLFIPAGHEVEHNQHPGLKLVSIHFNVELYSQLELLTECKQIFQGESPECREAFSALMNQENTSFAVAFSLHALLWQFLTLVTKTGNLSLEKQIRRFANFAPLLEAFGKTPTHDFSVMEMAGIMKMGKESFVKHFSAETGMSPKSFFNRIRAMAAARELLNPQFTIREISERFGFPNEFYFSRFFKRYMNSCPRDYRKNFTELP